MPRPFSEERIVSSIHVARKTGYLHAKGWTWIPIITYININCEWIKNLSVRAKL